LESDGAVPEEWTTAYPPDLSSRVSVSLLGGFATLIFGFAVLLGGALLPAFPSDPVKCSTEAAIRRAEEQDDAEHHVVGMSRSPGYLLHTVDRLMADRPSPAPTTRHHTGADVETARGRGTRTESVHLATIVLNPVGRDMRWELMEMAAAQRRDWSMHCPCPVYSVDVPPRGPR
jgi:hypothetical protein